MFADEKRAAKEVAETQRRAHATALHLPRSGGCVATNLNAVIFQATTDNAGTCQN